MDYTITINVVDAFNKLKYNCNYKNCWDISYAPMPDNPTRLFEYIITKNDQDIAWSVVTETKGGYKNDYDPDNIHSARIFIATFAVAESFRKQGWGTKLLNTILATQQCPIMLTTLSASSALYFYKQGANYLDTDFYEDGSRFMVFGDWEQTLKELNNEEALDRLKEINMREHKICKNQKCVIGSDWKDGECYCTTEWPEEN